jgi:hypothetical protein
MVFMQLGLAVGLFRASAGLAGLGLWSTGAPERRHSPVMAVLVFLQLATAVACRSTGALILLVLGIFVMFVTRWSRNYVVLFAVLLIPSAYVLSRTAAGWNGEVATDVAHSLAGSRRSESLDFRLHNEEKIAEHANQRPFFGWGGYSRAFPLDANGQCTWTPDSLWIIAFGTYGAVGLAALCALVLPIPALLLRVGPAAWARPEFAGAAIFSVLLMIYMLDNLVNNMPNPLFLVGLGGISGLAVAKRVPSTTAHNAGPSAWLPAEAQLARFL